MLNILPPEVAAVPVITYFVSALTDSPAVKTTIALVAGGAISHLSAQRPLTVKGVFCRENAEVTLLSAATAKLMHIAAPHLPMLNRPELPHLAVGVLFFLAGRLFIDSVGGVFSASRGD